MHGGESHAFLLRRVDGACFERDVRQVMLFNVSPLKISDR